MIGFKRALLLWLVSYCFFLVITLPASLIVTIVDKRLQNDTVSLTHVQGTIWSGSLNLVINKGAIKDNGSITVQWTIKPMQLLPGRIELDYDLKGNQLSASGQLSDGVGPFEMTLSSANFGPNWVNSFLRTQQIEIKTPVKFEEIFWQYELSDYFTHAAQGRITWAGGEVRRSGQLFRMNAMEGMIHASESGEAVLKISAQGDKGSLLEATLLTTGHLKVKVLKRVQGLLGMARPTRPDDTLMNLQYKVF